MSKQIVLSVILFVVALGSGIVIGIYLPHARHGPPMSESILATELQLTQDQRDKMREIWSDAGLHRDGFDKRRQMQKERDDSVIALLTPEQRKSYDQIQERYSQQTAEMAKEREAIFQKAIERTKAILSDKQRAKYEELLRNGSLGPPGGPPGGRRRGPATATVPTTAPAKTLDK